MKIQCPYCSIVHTQILVNAREIPDLAPFLCGHCKGLGIFDNGKVRKATYEEREAIVKSHAYENIIKPALDARKALDN